MYLAGTSQTDITPPIGYLLEGHDARKELSDGVHDSLKLKVITISNGKKRIAIVTSDLVYFSEEVITALRRDIYKKLKIAPADLFVTGSHTHTGPFLVTSHTEDPKRIIPDYINCLHLKITGCVIEAIRNEEKVNLHWGTGSVNIGVINRRLKTDKGVMMMPNPDGPVDHLVTVLGIITTKGQPKAILTNYTCHPTTLGTTIYQISADYPGVYQRIIEQVYPGAMACFTNGCCGDVRPAIVTGSQFKGGTFADAERMGKILAAEAIKTFEQSRPIENGKIEGTLKTIRLPVNKSLLPESARHVAELAVRHARTTTYPINHEDVQNWKKHWQAGLNNHRAISTTVPFEVQALKIGNARILGLAGEIMVDYGLKIKARAGDRPLMVCGYANAPIGYIPTTEALQDGGYETASFLWKKYPAPFALNMEETLIKECLNLL